MERQWSGQAELDISWLKQLGAAETLSFSFQRQEELGWILRVQRFRQMEP